MKTLTLVVIALFSLSLPAFPQAAGNYFTELHILSGEKESEEFIALFSKALREDAEQTEIYYWTEADKTGDHYHLMTLELATFYKEKRDYNKAFLFYSELVKAFPDNAKYLAWYADMELFRGNDTEAHRFYEKVLEIEPDNLSANSYMGNHYFLKAEAARKQLLDDYKKITSPTRMQQAKLNDALIKLYEDTYMVSRKYLENVIRLFPSSEAKRTLGKIDETKKMIYGRKHS